MAAIHLKAGTRQRFFALALAVLTGLPINPAVRRADAQEDVMALIKEAGDVAAAAARANRESSFAYALGSTQSTLKKLRNQIAPEFLLDLHFEMGLALHGLGRDREAEYELRLAVGRDSPGSASERVRESVLALSEIDLADGRIFEADQLANSALFALESLGGGDPLYHSRVLRAVASSDRATHYYAVATWRLLEAQDVLDGQPDSLAVRHERFLCAAALTRIAIDQMEESAFTSSLKAMRQFAATAEEHRQVNLLAIEHDRNQLLLNGDYPAAIARTDALASVAETDDRRVSHFLAAQRAADLGAIYFVAGDDVRAANSYREAIREDRLAFSSDYPLMSESQRHQFATVASQLVDKFLSFCISQPKLAATASLQEMARQKLLADAYSLVVWQKNLVAASLRAEAESVASSTDPQIQSLAAHLQKLRSQLAELRRTSPANPQIASRNQQIDEAERNLAQRMLEKGFQPDLGIERVLQSLDEQDAAVEIAVFSEWDREGPTNRRQYCALILTPGKKPKVELVPLGDAAHVEDDQLKLRRLTYANATQDDIDAYHGETWHRMEAVLAPARRIYFSPAGVLNSSPYLVWKHSDGRFLIDHKEIDLRPVFSTAELGAAPATAIREAVLLGDPDYDLGASAQPGASAGVVRSWRDLIGGTAKRLPASEAEVNAIYETLKDRQFSGPKPLLSAAATKEALLRVEHPYVLHVATHGYFWKSSTLGLELDPNGLEAAMQQSGLLLAGANKSIAAPEATTLPGDGIVTAVEIAGMQLHGTDLVVLSACDSGLGQETFASGEIGLRRALHIAGAAQVVVSLWEVDSNSTADFMKVFYDKWTKGADRYEALRDAAKEIRGQAGHDAPYYWAAFVLFGE